MEQQILKVLDFDLANVNPIHFLRRFSKAAGSTYYTHSLCKYIIESSLLSIQMLKYRPSIIAASAVYISRAMTHETPLWNKTLEYYTTYEVEDISRCVLELNNLLHHLEQSHKLFSVKKKFADPKCGAVSKISCVDIDFWIKISINYLWRQVGCYCSKVVLLWPVELRKNEGITEFAQDKKLADQFWDSFKSLGYDYSLWSS